MGMPNHLVLVRHGESEANICQRLEKEGRGDEVPLEYYDTHDWEFHLSQYGIEQAKRAGAWMLENIGDPQEFFDRRYSSKFIRARETAAFIGGAACSWRLDDRLKERDWGTYGSIPRSERASTYPLTEKLRNRSSWYTRLDGGEGLSDNVAQRFRDWLDTLHREMDGKNVIAVTHGELMWTARYVLEHMLPEEWDVADMDKSQRIHNCGVIWYSRVNPNDPGEVSKSLTWRRMVYPDNIEGSPFGGEWVELSSKRYLTGEELLNGVEHKPRLFGNQDVTV